MQRFVRYFILCDSNNCVFLFPPDFRHCSNPGSSIFSRKASCHIVTCFGFYFTLCWFAATKYYLCWGLILNLSVRLIHFKHVHSCLHACAYICVQESKRRVIWKRVKKCVAFGIKVRSSQLLVHLISVLLMLVSGMTTECTAELLLQEQMKLERTQILSLFMKAMKKIYKYLRGIASKEIESTLPRIKEVSW